MKRIYKTKDWEYLQPLDRVDLMTLIEDVRQGASIKISEKEKPNFECFLNQYNLAHKSFPFKKDVLAYYISKSKPRLDDFVLKITKGSPLLNGVNRGLFLGYPECCSEWFAELKIQGILPGKEWNKKAKQAFEKGRYNPVLDYKIHLPCDIECNETLKMTKEIKKVIEKSGDEEAIKQLMFMNRLFLKLG